MDKFGRKLKVELNPDTEAMFKKTISELIQEQVQEDLDNRFMQELATAQCLKWPSKEIDYELAAKLALKLIFEDPQDQNALQILKLIYDKAKNENNL